MLPRDIYRFVKGRKHSAAAWLAVKIAYVESGFDPTAVSPLAESIGLLQFTMETFAEYYWVHDGRWAVSTGDPLFLVYWSNPFCQLEAFVNFYTQISERLETDLEIVYERCGDDDDAIALCFHYGPTGAKKRCSSRSSDHDPDRYLDRLANADRMWSTYRSEW